ncbi:hypothetical protein MBLNU230_g8337t1 [Neophaeotheca triangularis]
MAHRLPGPASSHTRDIDLNSNQAVTPNIQLKPANSPDTKIVIFNCTHPRATCLRFKQWLLLSWAGQRMHDPDILRIEYQDLASVKVVDKATLVLLEDSATLDGKANRPITIFALFLPHVERIRWFYSLLSPSPIITDLHGKNAISIARQLLPNTNPHHEPLYTFLTEHFTRAIAIPDSPDWLTANQVTDYAPSIRSPETALSRITSLETLYTNPSTHLDLSTDRYLSHLHPAEIELASTVQLKSAQYLFTKRFFFQDFGQLCIRNREALQAQVDGVAGARVLRSEFLHAQWLERAFGWKVTRARRLVAGWKVLGFLDERRFLAWAREGAMVEGAGLVAEGEGDEDGEGYEEMTGVAQAREEV